MGQQEILNWLTFQRLTHPNKFFSIREIYRKMPKEIRGEHRTVVRNINRLYAFGFLDVEVKSKGIIFHIERKFRAKGI